MAKLYFRYSAMNAGKSTALLQVAHNYEENDKNVLLYTAEIDDRFDPGTITSRLGPQRNSRMYNQQTDFFADLSTAQDLSCVLLDEAQFLLPAQVRQLHQAAHVLGIPVICYGLRSDFQGEPFPGSVYLLTLACSKAHRSPSKAKRSTARCAAAASTPRWRKRTCSFRPWR